VFAIFGSITGAKKTDKTMDVITRSSFGLLENKL
jgi:hypothetical protein